MLAALDMGGFNITNLGGITSNLTVGTGTGGPIITINGGAGSFRPLRFQSNGVSRWTIAATSTAESGANAGSNLMIQAFDDAGGSLGTAIGILRASKFVGISTGAPTEALDVVGNVKASGTITAVGAVSAASAGFGGALVAGATTLNGNLLLNTNTLNFAGGPSVRSPSANRWSVTNDGSGNERIAANSSGDVMAYGSRNFGTGVDLPGSGCMRVAATGTAGNRYSLTLYDDADWKALQVVRLISGTPTEVGSISATSTGITVNTTSDETLKDDDGELTFNEAWAIVQLWTIHKHRWKVNGEEDVNAFAQELYEVYPRAVTPGGWSDDFYTPWSVDYSKLIPVMIPVLQGVVARLEAAGL